VIEYSFSLVKMLGYIDPGFLSSIGVVIISAIVGVGMTLKIYWYKIKQKISRD